MKKVYNLNEAIEFFSYHSRSNVICIAKEIQEECSCLFKAKAFFELYQPRDEIEVEKEEEINNKINEMIDHYIFLYNRKPSVVILKEEEFLKITERANYIKLLYKESICRTGNTFRGISVFSELDCCSGKDV